MGSKINPEILKQVFNKAQEILNGMNAEERQPYDNDINNIRDHIQSAISGQENTPKGEVSRNQIFEFLSNPENLKNFNIPFTDNIIELVLKSAQKTGSLESITKFLTSFGGEELITNFLGGTKGGDLTGMLSGILGGSKGEGGIAGILSNFLK